MPKTEGWIWIDEQDKAIVRMEAFAAKGFADSTNTGKPLIIGTFSRVPEGFWFWKSVRFETIGNKAFFPELKGNWQIENFDYKRFRVEVEEPKIDKP